MSGNYEAIIQTIYDLKEVLTEDERNSMLQKYVPSLFNGFLQIYQSTEEDQFEEIKEEEQEEDEYEEETKM